MCKELVEKVGRNIARKVSKKKEENVLEKSEKER